MDEACVESLTRVTSLLKSENLLNEHLMLQSGEDRIKLVLQVMSREKIIPQIYGYLKNVQQSENFRKDGNTLFVSTKSFNENNCLELVRLYNKSIAYAPCQSKELALGYANRSAILLELRMYELCIQDIDRVLALPCPDNIRAKLYVRKVKCLTALGHPSLRDSIEEVRGLLEQLELDDTVRRNFFEKLNSIKGPGGARKRDDLQQLPLLRINHRNSEVPCACDAVKIMYSEQYGRHIIATRDIEAGELISVEEAYSQMLVFDKIYTNCFHCLKMCWTIIPCDHCTSAMYCSEDCKTKSWKKYHDIECSIFYSVCKLCMEFDEVNVCSLRIAIQAVKEFPNIEELRKEVTEIDNWREPRTKGFSNDGVLTSDKYRSVLGLLTNTEKRKKEELLMLSFHSCFILYYIATRTNLFKNPLEEDLLALANNNDVVFIGSLLLRHLQMCRINGHNINEESGAGIWVKCGFGILPFSSLLNHSCNPNTLLKYKARRAPDSHAIRRFATFPIKTGEQLFTCYVQTGSKRDRQDALLEHYHFTCNCHACEENWSVGNKMAMLKKYCPEDLLKTLKVFVDQIPDENLRESAERQGLEFDESALHVFKGDRYNPPNR